MASCQDVPVHPSRPRPVLGEFGDRTTDPIAPGSPNPHGPRWKIGRRYQAKVFYVVDGDTIVVSWADQAQCASFPTRIRLAGLDAPELYPKSQPGGMAAKQALEQLTASQPLTVCPTHSWPDKYGRMIARVGTSLTADLSLEMIRTGFATEYRRRRYICTINLAFRRIK